MRGSRPPGDQQLNALFSLLAAGLESGGVRTSVLGQALLAASSTISLGVSALQQQAVPDGAAGAAAAPGTTPRPLPAITPRGGILPSPRPASGLTPRTGGATPRTPGLAAVLEGGGAGAGRANTQLAAMFAWRPDPDVVVHGWAAADGDALRHSVRSRGLQGLQPEQWGLSLGSYPDGTGNGWAVGLGRSSAVAAAAAAAGGSSSGSAAGGREGSSNGAPNLFELSLQFSVGEGMLVTPGVLCAVHGGRTTLFAGLKTTWDW
jgi:hypothetical protein